MGACRNTSLISTLQILVLWRPIYVTDLEKAVVPESTREAIHMSELQLYSLCKSVNFIISGRCCFGLHLMILLFIYVALLGSL